MNNQNLAIALLFLLLAVFFFYLLLMQKSFERKVLEFNTLLLKLEEKQRAEVNNETFVDSFNKSLSK